jgi:primosomal protein N''
MGIFEILAETKIKEWLRQPKPKTALKEAPKEDKKTFEGYLLDEIRNLISQAATETGEVQKATLAKANGLQIQLLVSLEQSGHFMIAKETEKIILKHRMKCLG